MVHPNKKKQKMGDNTACTEEVLFNSDALSKIISYLPSVDVLNLALTCTRFGISNTNDNDDSIIKESTRIAVQDIATEEQLAALPHYEGENSLADYHYLQLMREPLTFDQLVGHIEYVDSGDKSCVTNSDEAGFEFETAFSNNILRAGKHYVTFETHRSSSQLISILVGVMRPGQVNHNAKGYPLARGIPLDEEFYQHFSRRFGDGEHNNNNVQCCMYKCNGYCFSGDWEDQGGEVLDKNWDGMEEMSSGDTIGMLLDLDEGTLTVYKNDRKLGVMKRGLAGPYCWVVSIHEDVQVTIKRGTIPSS